MSKAELSPALLAALALTAKHVEADALLAPVKIPMKSAQELRKGNPRSIKVRRNRKRNKLAAQSRKRNRR